VKTKSQKRNNRNRIIVHGNRETFKERVKKVAYRENATGETKNGKSGFNDVARQRENLVGGKKEVGQRKGGSCQQ